VDLDGPGHEEQLGGDLRLALDAPRADDGGVLLII
jgi:hypothetical protein